MSVKIGKLIFIVSLLAANSSTFGQPSSSPVKTFEEQIRWSMGLPLQPTTVLPTEIPKYRVGDGIVEMIDGRRTILIVVRVYWDGYQWKYVKVPDWRMEI